MASTMSAFMTGSSLAISQAKATSGNKVLTISVISSELP